MGNENNTPVQLVLEILQLSPEEGEVFLSGYVQTNASDSSLSVVFEGERETYPVIMFRQNNEGALRFRVRIPVQSFSAHTTAGGKEVPASLVIPDSEPIVQWKEPFAFEEIPGIGVLVPTPTGFDLVRNNAIWLAKRRLLRLKQGKSIKGIDALRFWDKEEQRIASLPYEKNVHILDTPQPASPQKVNLEYWCPTPDTSNLGDYLSLVVCNWMLKKKGLSFDTATPETHFLTAIGSILQLGRNDSTVWGTGLLWAKCPRFISPETKALDIRAVRGPETRRLLVKRGYACPEVFGDPAILMPLIYQPAVPEKTLDHLTVCHMFDQEKSDVNIATSDYRGFIDKLVSARLVISSSLHGIILAESYGVPAILLDDCRPDFSLHKYRDWYLSTGRTEFPVARTVEEALTLTPPPLPDLVSMQQHLMEVFPYDLWEQ